MQAVHSFSAWTNLKIHNKINHLKPSKGSQILFLYFPNTHTHTLLGHAHWIIWIPRVLLMHSLTPLILQEAEIFSLGPVLGHCRPEKPECSLQISIVNYICFLYLFLTFNHQQ